MLATQKVTSYDINMEFFWIRVSVQVRNRFFGTLISYTRIRR